MKLALVIEKYDPSGGGAERSTRQIASELVGRGNDVTVFCAQCPRDLQSDGKITITRMPKSGKLTAADEAFAGFLSKFFAIASKTSVTFCLVLAEVSKNMRF